MDLFSLNKTAPYVCQKRTSKSECVVYFYVYGLRAESMIPVLVVVVLGRDLFVNVSSTTRLRGNGLGMGWILIAPGFEFLQ